MIVGLTGGIGTGKSTVSRKLRERGYPVIDLDVISMNLSEILEMKFWKIRIILLERKAFQGINYDKQYSKKKKR